MMELSQTDAIKEAGVILHKALNAILTISSSFYSAVKEHIRAFDSVFLPYTVCMFPQLPHLQNGI